MQENSNTNQQGGDPNAVGSEQENPTVSARKLEANRQNAQKSTGPRTEEGKAKSAQNAYKHGFFTSGLFTAPQAEADREPYKQLLGGLYEHYKPVGDWETLWVEKIAREFLRLARVMRFEEQVILEQWIKFFRFEGTDKVLRYENAANRRVNEAIEQLERLQAKRRAEAARSNGSTSSVDEGDGATSGEPAEESTERP